MRSFAVVLALLTLLAACGTAQQEPRHPPSPLQGANVDGMDVPDQGAPGEPCPMAKHANTIEELQTDDRIWASTSAMLTDAWTCDGGFPVLMYGTTQIIANPAPGLEEGPDIDKKWARSVRESGGRIETALGRPAWVHPAGATGSLRRPEHGPSRSHTSVHVFVDHTIIIVWSTKNDVPVEKLIEMTNSLERVQ